MKQWPSKMSQKGSLARAIKQIRRGIADPYDGVMYEKGRPVRGEWVNGLRIADARLLLEAVERKP